MLPRLKQMHPRTSDTGIMNIGNTYSTAILQYSDSLDVFRVQDTAHTLQLLQEHYVMSLDCHSTC